MDNNFSSRPQKLDSASMNQKRGSYLILHNDEVNTFEFVMETLVDVCDHSSTQAEQCALIAHYKGKCEVMRGDINELRKVSEKLISRGLKSTIE